MARIKEAAEAQEQIAVQQALDRDRKAKEALQAERDAHAATMRSEAAKGKNDLELLLDEMSVETRHAVRLRAFAHYLSHMSQEPMSRQSDVDLICLRFAKYVLFGEVT